MERLNHATNVTRSKLILSELLGFELDPESIVGDLPLSLKQDHNCRGMLTNPRLLILDESSAALDYEATERLFSKAMRSLASGGCAIFIVTHRIAELVRIADRATVLRDGRSVGTLEKVQITEET